MFIEATTGPHLLEHGTAGNRAGRGVRTGRVPEEAAAFADQFHYLLESLDQEERQIVLLRLEDRTQVEIAAAIRTSERTVRRLMKQLEERRVGVLGER